MNPRQIITFDQLTEGIENLRVISARQIKALKDVKVAWQLGPGPCVLVTFTGPMPPDAAEDFITVLRESLPFWIEVSHVVLDIQDTGTFKEASFPVRQANRREAEAESVLGLVREALARIPEVKGALTERLGALIDHWVISWDTRGVTQAERDAAYSAFMACDGPVETSLDRALEAARGARIAMTGGTRRALLGPLTITEGIAAEKAYDKVIEGLNYPAETAIGPALLEAIEAVFAMRRNP